jgi:hypothetical protein
LSLHRLPPDRRGCVRHGRSPLGTRRRSMDRHSSIRSATSSVLGLRPCMAPFYASRWFDVRLVDAFRADSEADYRCFVRIEESDYGELAS